MIGTLAEATEIANVIAKRAALPSGWSVIGQGAYRTAYLSPSGVVYKSELQHGSKNNAGEARRYREIMALKPKGFRPARCRLFKRYNLLAMEHIVDDRGPVNESWRAMADFMHRNFNYYDCSEIKRGRNWHGVNGCAIITDYAYGFDE
jgi:hypothetical protein